MEFYLKGNNGENKEIVVIDDEEILVDLEKTCYVLFIVEKNKLNFFSVYLNEDHMKEEKLIIESNGARTFVKEVPINL